MIGSSTGDALDRRAWTEDRLEVVQFARVMVKVEYVTDLETMLDYFEYPWTFQRERTWWLAHNRSEATDTWDDRTLPLRGFR